MLELTKFEWKNDIIYDFSTLEMESDFIISILSLKSDLKIIEKIAYPGSTFWKLEIENHLVNLANNK